MIARLTEKNGQQGMIDQEPIGRPYSSSAPTPLTPTAGLGTVGEITDAVLYMCSEQSSFMVGHNMVIDGGQTAGIWK
jgi:NAD(P)-dependent dehydrogenase (short-subunit alcohol dehydrogenase family)